MLDHSVKYTSIFFAGLILTLMSACARSRDHGNYIIDTGGQYQVHYGANIKGRISDGELMDLFEYMKKYDSRNAVRVEIEKERIFIDFAKGKNWDRYVVIRYNNGFAVVDKELWESHELHE